MLLEHGADESATNKRGYTALHEALDDGNDLNARFLWLRTLRCDPWVAAGLDDVTQLRVLLTESPAHLTAVDGRGRTPLHWAARCGALESTRILIEAGAPLEARDECGSTPLYWAAAGYPAFEGFGPNTTSLGIARLLVEGGASHDCVNDAGKRPIDFVTQKWKPALASWLESLDR